MKQNKRILSILILLVLMTTFLSGCGSSLRGTYEDEDGYYRLALGEDKMVFVSDLYYAYGPYEVKGNQLIHDHIDSYGDGFTTTYDFRQKGNNLILVLPESRDEIVFVPVDGNNGGSSFLPVIMGILAVIVVVAAVLALLKKKGRRPENRSSERQNQQEINRNVSKKVAASAGELRKHAAEDRSSAVPADAAAEVAADRNTGQEAKQIPITNDSCCICGRSLDDGATPLGGLTSGKAAWIDNTCLAKLQTMAQSDDEQAFESAARYMKKQAKYVDPDVKTALLRFVRKSETRFYES